MASNLRLRLHYLILGVAWAPLLAPLTFLALVSLAAAISWLWLYGDDPWPAATQWVLPLIGAAGAVLVAFACVIFATRYGRKRATLAQMDQRAERRRILILLAIPLLGAVLLGVKVWSESQDYSDALAAATQREAEYAALVGARHEIRNLVLHERPGGDFRATLELVGMRTGNYRLSWDVLSTSIDATLTTGARVVWLRPGRREVHLHFALDDLARGYHAKLQPGRGGVLVEEEFQIEVSLEPMLSETEAAGLPPGEIHRLAAGGSHLQSRRTTLFPVRFVIRGDGTIGR
jgi:hypothetical protein